MGSSSTVKIQEIYDGIYGIAYDVLRPHGLDIYVKDTKKATTKYPQQYVYLEQVTGAFKKKTLAPSVFDVTTEFLCEIHVNHANIAKGGLISQQLQLAFHNRSSNLGLVVENPLATDHVTQHGRTYVVALTLTHKIKVD